MAAHESVPILFIIFNRPDLTEKVFSRIQEFRPDRLFVAADGPRSGRAGEEELCELTRAVTRDIDWECEVHRLERKENLGCKLAVSSAISWFFEHVEEGIILEDDCLPDPTFFKFCAELLERYRHDNAVGLISGNHFQTGSKTASYYFSRYPHIWGWASWQRVWQKYDVAIQSWNGDPLTLAPFVKNTAVRKRFGKRFDSVKSGVKDTWDFQLVYLCFSEKLLSINPTINLVANIGFDERATHTTKRDPEDALPDAKPMAFPLIHPESVVIDEAADRFTEIHVQKVPPHRWAVWKNSLRKRMKKFTDRSK